MKKLMVYADFDWLKDIELVGELSYESLRGSDSYTFYNEYKLTAQQKIQQEQTQTLEKVLAYAGTRDGILYDREGFATAL